MNLLDRSLRRALQELALFATIAGLQAPLRIPVDPYFLRIIGTTTGVFFVK